MIDDVLKLSELKNLKVELIDREYVLTLVDDQEYEVIKGYGVSISSAFNDLLHNLF